MKKFFPYFLFLIGLLLFIAGCEGTATNKKGDTLVPVSKPAPIAPDKVWQRQTFDFPIRPLISYDGKVLLAQGGGDPYTTVYESTDGLNWQDKGGSEITGTTQSLDDYVYKDLNTYPGSDPARLKLFALGGENYTWDHNQVFKRTATGTWSEVTAWSGNNNLDFGAVGTYNATTKKTEGPYYSRKKRFAVTPFELNGQDLTFEAPRPVPAGLVSNGMDATSVKMLDNTVFVVVKQKTRVPAATPIISGAPQTELYSAKNNELFFKRVDLSSTNMGENSEIRLIKENKDQYLLAIQTALSNQGPVKAPIRLYRGTSDLSRWVEIPALADLFKGSTGQYSQDITLDDFQYVNGAYVMLVNQTRHDYVDVACNIITSKDLITFKSKSYASTYCFNVYSVNGNTLVMAEEGGELPAGDPKFRLAVIPIAP